MANADTLFDILERGLMAASARGITGTISPIDNGVVVEMLDDTLRDQTRHAGRFFEGTIQSEDIWPLPLWGTWKGTVLTIDYPGEISERVGEPQLRPHVPGTLRYVEETESYEVPEGDSRAVWRVYNPRLVIMIKAPWRMQHREWDASVASGFDWREEGVS